MRNCNASKALSNFTPRKERERRHSSAASSFRRHSAEAKGPTRQCVKVLNQYNLSARDHGFQITQISTYPVITADSVKGTLSFMKVPAFTL